MRKDNVDLICSIGELAGLFEQTASLPEFLQKVVSIVAHHMKAAVCSVYLYDEQKEALTLSANQGLNPEYIGNAFLKLGEGITGMSLKELRPIREGNAATNRNFKLIQGLGEDAYRAFLAVPILRGLERVGVIVLQDPIPDYFTENDEKALRAIAAQLASTIETSKLLLALHPEGLGRATEVFYQKKSEVKLLRGAKASGGVACGPGTILGHLDIEDLVGGESHDSKHTLDDFDRAILATEHQLEELQRDLDEQLADVASLIFSAHLLMLKDASFSGEMRNLIQGGTPPARAIARVVKHYADLFSKSQNPMLQEKVQDVRDLGHRLLHNLFNRKDDSADYNGQIVIAKTLLPSDTIKLVAQRAAGLIVAGGGVTSHVAILARSLQLPMLVVKDSSILELPEGTMLLLDADQGNVFVNPAAEVRDSYEELRGAAEEATSPNEDVKEETQTADGTRIRLMANINLLNDLKIARRLKAEGVGLYRSEMPFIVRNSFPSEEEQYRIYRCIVDEMEGREVTFRTLDIGGDKMLSYYSSVTEANPFLGLRAIRFSLQNQEIFSQQLRAMLRAGAGAPIRIMFPLISSLDDFFDAREVVHACIAELRNLGIAHNADAKIGIMVELPSAVEVIDDLAEEADFLCIGTNDLIQYTLAVDRTNEAIADMYLPYHPAVLRALKRIVDAAGRAETNLSICGEMAANTQLIPFLLGIGIRELSVDSRLIPEVQKRISGITLEQAIADAEVMLHLKRIKDIEEYIGA